MRIAVPYNKADGAIAEDFAEAEAVMLYMLEGDDIVSTLSVPAFGSGAEAVLDTLRTAKADVLICGGITRAARQAAAAAGIMTCPGFGGSADDAARAFASGGLKQDEGHDCANCSHDCDHHHHHD